MPGRAGKDCGGAGLARFAPALSRIAPALAVIALTAGCSIDYGNAGTETTDTGGIPDTVAVNVQHRVWKDGHLTLQMQAARAESYNSRNQTILTDARFTTFDDKGKTSTDGSASTVVYHTDTENAEITGGVHVHSTTEEGDVTAESLTWENKTHRLTAPPQETVTLQKDDGTALRGTGFAGDFLRREITFSGPVHGTYVYTPK